MTRTQLLIALRRLWKNKTASFINIFGLSLGLLAFVLILEYVAFEWSYNQMYSKSDRIFRLLVKDSDGGMYLPPGYGPILKERFPSIKTSVRILPNVGNGIFQTTGSSEPKIFREDNTAFVDAAFFDLFEQDIVSGRADLSAPQTAAISQSVARKYFGEFDPIGQQLKVSNQFGDILYETVAVFGDMAPNSDVQHDILLSVQTLAVEANRNGNGWADPNGTNSGFANIFVELNSGDQAATVAVQITELGQELAPKDEMEFALQSLTHLHLGEGLYDPLPTFGSGVFCPLSIHCCHADPGDCLG